MRPKVVLIDEAELVLEMFVYLNQGKFRPVGGDARASLEVMQKLCRESDDDIDWAAYKIAADLAKIAMAWLHAQANAQHPGTFRRFTGSTETRQ